MTTATAPHNYSRRFTIDNLDIRGQVVRLTDVWRDMHDGRHYPPNIRQFLGELACVAVLVGAGLKHPGRAALQIQRKHAPDATGAETFSGPVAVLDCTESLALRGMAGTHIKPAEAMRASSGSATFSEWVDDCTLAMTITYVGTTQIYQSIVPVSGLSVAECFEHYFDLSEQLPTHLWLAASATGAGALLLQKLPNADQKDADGWARVEQLAASVRELELTTLPAEQLLARLFSEEDVRIYEAKPVSYACKRDVQKVEGMLRSLGREEVEATLAELGVVEVNDDICNQVYRFDADAIKRLFD
ncbi:MAG: Hsp33 family molecular chaperone HslO [Burkholderiales bacterium]|nr:Hsp33 family molecular chaperone HslO [Burkholderiales bacterium]